MDAKTEYQFSQKQYAPIWHAAFGLLVTSSLGIAYASAVSARWGTAVGLVLSLAVIYWWLQKAVEIVVTAEKLQVGKFCIERHHLGEIKAFEKSDFLQRIRGDAHRQDVLVLRNINQGGVVVEIKDTADPFCHWVISCKSPHKLASTLNGDI
ncbi:MAG: hypothetical protein RLZZ330_967 [Actinomycetota bacterium]|jgi:hypothetical protein